MNDKPDPNLEALFGAARAAEPDVSRLEYGFETRLLARLREDRGISIFGWAWRLCPVFLALAVVVGWWSHTSLRNEAEVLFVAEAAHGNDDQMLVAYLTGDRP